MSAPPFYTNLRDATRLPGLPRIVRATYPASLFGVTSEASTITRDQSTNRRPVPAEPG